MAAAGEAGMEHVLEVLGRDPSDGLGLGELDGRVLGHVHGHAQAALPVRLPTRVWSIHSLSCSMVNSVSHMSR